MLFTDTDKKAKGTLGKGISSFVLQHERNSQSVAYLVSASSISELP